MLNRIRRNWAMLALAVALIVCLAVTIRSGHMLYTALISLIASPVLLAALATWVEGRRLWDVANPRKAAWSFLIGDPFVLTPALVLCAHAWQDIPSRGWHAAWWWVALSLALGFAAGTAFHVWDGGNYRRVGAGNRLGSPTKMAHDFVAYPTLFAAMVYGGVPLLAHWSWHTWAVLGCVALWVALVACDAVRQPQPSDMHPAWDEDNCQSIPDSK